LLLYILLRQRKAYWGVLVYLLIKVVPGTEYLAKLLGIDALDPIGVLMTVGVSFGVLGFISRVQYRYFMSPLTGTWSYLIYRLKVDSWMALGKIRFNMFLDLMCSLLS
jgi:hypothetical protein